MSKTPTYFIKTGVGTAKLFNKSGVPLSEVLVKDLPEGLEDKTVYTIELNEKQLRLIWVYLEKLTRINAMQLDEAVDGMMANIAKRGQIVEYSQAYFEKKKELSQALYQVLNKAGFSNGESLGIGQVSEQDKICYEMYKMIGHALYIFDGVENYNVYSTPPMKYSKESFIRINIKDQTNED